MSKQEVIKTEDTPKINELAEEAKRCGVDFSRVSPEAEGLLKAMANCCEILEIKPVRVLASLQNSPELRSPEAVMRLAFKQIVDRLPWVEYHDREERDEGSIYLGPEETNNLRRTLGEIVGGKYFRNNIAIGYVGTRLVSVFEEHARRGELQLFKF